MDHRPYIERSIELAAERPSEMSNPFVGAVLVGPDGRVLGEGRREFIGGTHLTRHAERVAIDRAGSVPRGARLYTTLEPCVLIRRRRIMAPCADYIVRAGIRWVAYGVVDPWFGGGGLSALRRAGVTVEPYDSLVPQEARDALWYRAVRAQALNTEAMCESDRARYRRIGAEARNASPAITFEAQKSPGTANI